MSRSNSKTRRYTNVRELAEKQRERSGASYLKIPNGVKLFKPKAGIMLLDILPFEAGKGNPFADPGMLHWERSYYVHHNIGVNNDRVICPAKTAKKRCPVCELRMKLMKEDDEDNEEEIKSYQVSHRQLFNVMNRKDPDAGVQLFDVSHFCFGEAILSAVNAADEDEGVDTFFLLEGGSTLKVNFEESSFGGNKFMKADRVDFKQRKEDLDEELMENVICLDDILVIHEYDALKKMLLAEDDEDEEEEDEEEDAPKARKKPARDDDDEDEEEEPVKSKKSKSKSDDDEDDEEDEDEEEDDEPKAKKKKAPKDDDDWDDFDEDDEEKPKAKKKSKPAEEEEEEEEADEEDEEDEPKSRKKKNRFDDDEDGWDHDKDDDEEDEPKSKKKKVKASKADDDDEEDED